MSLDKGGIDVGRSVTPLQVKILSQWTPTLSGRTRGWGGRTRGWGGGTREPSLSLKSFPLILNTIFPLLSFTFSSIVYTVHRSFHLSIFPEPEFANV